VVPSIASIETDANVSPLSLEAMMENPLHRTDNSLHRPLSLEAMMENPLHRTDNSLHRTENKNIVNRLEIKRAFDKIDNSLSKIDNSPASECRVS